MAEDARQVLGVPWSLRALRSLEFEQGWLVEPLIPDMGRFLIVATYKTGKSLMAWQLAHCIALGVPFLGFNIPKAKKVYYLDFEMGPVLLKDHGDKAAQVYPEADSNIVVNSFPRGELREFLAPPGLKDVGLVIVDPAIRLGYKNENDSAEVRGKLDEVSDIVMNELGAAVAVVHHARKPNREPGAVYQGVGEARGSSAFGDWMDGAMDILKMDDDVFRVGFLTRGAQSPDSMVITRDPETLTYAIRENVGQQGLEDAVAEVVLEWQMDTGVDKKPPLEEVVKRLQKRLRRGRTSIYQLLKQNGISYNKYEE